MKIGELIETPRFMRVRITEIFEDEKSAQAAGYKEPTHYKGEYDILGKIYGINMMKFAAVKKG